MNNSQEILDIIMQKITKSGLTAKECLISCDINTSFLTDWKNGKTKTPSYDKIIKLAEYLDIDFYYLFLGIEKNNDMTKTNSLSSEESELLQYFRKLSVQERSRLIGRAELLAEQAEAETNAEPPMIRCKHSFYKVSAGTGYSLDEGDAWQDEIEIPDTPTNRKADLCITIKGNSMEPVYMDGDIVLVKSQKSIDLGQIGIFNVGGKGYIKKYGRDRLISLNEDCDDIMFSDHEYDNIECVGIVLGRI